jgi:RNA polymerase sigma-70 factor (ECF subfamily)
VSHEDSDQLDGAASVVGLFAPIRRPHGRGRATLRSVDAENLGDQAYEGLVTDATAKAELIEACYHAGCEQFPNVSWDAAGFAAHCLTHWAGRSASDLSARLRTGNGLAEEYLVAACLAGRRGAALALERDYISKLAGRVRKVCRNSDLADDALQILREKVLLPPEPKLASYENRGHLAAWLTIVAVRTALDVARRTQHGTLRMTPLDDDLVAHALSPESQCSTREFDLALRQAMRDAVRRLPDKQRFALKMQVVAGWSIDQIGRALSTHRATAARWLVDARTRMEQDVRSSLVQGLGLRAAEVDAALGAMRSRLDVRVSQFFQSTQASELVARGAERAR